MSEDSGLGAAIMRYAGTGSAGAQGDRLIVEIRQCLGARHGLLRSGRRGQLVRLVQQRLSDLGYSLTADGLYGRRTYAAVSVFQAKVNLSADGICGPDTLAALFLPHGDLAAGVTYRSTYPLSQFRPLFEELVMADDRLHAAEARFMEVVFAGLPQPDGNGRDASTLDEHQKRELFGDLCLLAACDGDFDARERAWLIALATDIGLPPQERDEALELTQRLANEFAGGEDAPQRAVEALARNAATAGAIGAVLWNGVRSVVGEAGFSYGVEIAGSLWHGGSLADGIGAGHDSVVSADLVAAVSDGDHLEVARELVRSAIDEVGGDVVGDALEAVLDGVPIAVILAAPAMVRAIVAGDLVGAGKKAGQVAAEGVAAKVAGAAVGGAAGVAAGTIAYAGVGGTLLQVGVFLGLASPPALVVAAGVGGAIAGAWAARRLVRHLFS